MSATPRTDALAKKCGSFEQFIAEFEKLETELNQLKEQCEIMAMNHKHHFKGCSKAHSFESECLFCVISQLRTRVVELEKGGAK